MTLMAVMPRDTDEWTVDDLDAIPDDGLQYELIDGVLIVSPAPAPRHQRALRELVFMMYAVCPPELEVFFAPLDCRPDRRNSLQPDLMVVRRSEVGERNIQVPPLLAVEVLSPSTRRKDLRLKRSVYEEWGIGSFWYLDPVEQAFSASDLVDGRYEEVSKAVRDQKVTVARPYEVEICPAELCQFERPEPMRSLDAWLEAAERRHGRREPKGSPDG
jgi:Uma2 family endonuclease